MPSLSTDRKAHSACARFWRSLAEAEGGEGGDQRSDAAQPLLGPLFGLSRRDFMKVMGASLALGTAGCSHPPLEKIFPYVHGPAQDTYGIPVYYAWRATQKRPPVPDS